jgi:uncharacterized membrane protein YphA (DoxX/SURF4 family)
LTQLGVNLALVFLGAGAWSIDGWVARGTGGRSDPAA